MAEIGKRSTLKVVRAAPPGVYLDGGPLGEILLPRRFVPRRIMPGDPVDVFVYRDSEDRLVATTEIPRANVGEIATLKVVGLHQRVGAFLDWGLSKDLLLPFREQTAPVKPGQEVLVRIYLDPKSHRIVASMKMEDTPAPDANMLRPNQAVQFVITEKTDLGFKALVEGSHTGLLYHDNLTTPVRIGQKLNGFVRNIRPDGRIDLTLNQAGFQRTAPLALRIVQALKKNEGKLNLDDDSSPETIRGLFAVSKKAFKQALGTLYKSRRIRFTHPGIELLDDTKWSPGEPLQKARPEPRPRPSPPTRLPNRPPRSRPR